MVQSANLGFPRMGIKRELKKALESYWKSSITEEELQEAAKALRKRHWQLQQDAGIDIIPSNDFSLYDQVLDMTATLGAVPERYKHTKGQVSTETYFAMARGSKSAAAMEMSKWFDTNYHYIVPEIEPDTEFRLSSSKIIDEYKEALALGIKTRPVIIGPVTYLYLSKTNMDGFDKFSKLGDILTIYEKLLQQLKFLGCEWVQIDEPALVIDLDQTVLTCFEQAYTRLKQPDCPKLMLTTYFGGIEHNLPLISKLDVDGLHIDLVRAPEQVGQVIEDLGRDTVISLGIIDGRNIWRANLRRKFEIIIDALVKRASNNIQLAPSCSLLHTPIDLEQEIKLDEDLKLWQAFAKQKLNEISILCKGVSLGASAIAEELSFSDTVAHNRNTSPRVHNHLVRERMAHITPDMLKRKSPFVDRKEKQQKRLRLPALPTTTIGSFPQTTEVRAARASWKKGNLSDADYNNFLKQETEKCIRYQEQAGIDVLVHGEFERNDMVEYFGEQLSGIAFTKLGWVQSYGSRCVKPPVIYGDVFRPEPMTVEWAKYSKSLTDLPVKGMLTGPVTILQWSFVRDDQPRSVTCNQIGLAIRDEVIDLEHAGIEVIQIDEPALREGLPLRNKDKADYLNWAINAFRLGSTGVQDETQIHTHMCYCEFNDIMTSIAALDADVISIETSRSNMELLQSFTDFQYPNDIGPGVYDIHSPRVPDVEDMVHLLTKAAEVIDARQIWVNPDCGLKTRGWPEVESALQKMVSAAKEVRTQIS